MYPTKKRIIYQALDLFSTYGYEAVSVAQLADSIGIKAPSLYKHYRSKQAIFEAIIIEMEQHTSSLTMFPFEDFNVGQNAKVLLALPIEQVVWMGKQIFAYFIHDTYHVQFRKLLTLEQYHKKELANIYTKLYIDQPIAYLSELISNMQNINKQSYNNADLLARCLYSPLYVFLTQCDRHPENETIILLQVEEFIHTFWTTHMIKNNKF